MATVEVCSVHPARYRIARLLQIAVAGMLLGTATASTNTGGVTCPAGNFIVVDATPHDTEMVCDAAADTVRFMEAHGFQMGKSVTTVHLVRSFSVKTFASTLGAYIAGTNRIELLTYETALKQMPDRPAFGLPVNRAIYRSFIVHEMAHAIAHANFKRHPVTSAHEYIAYTVQLATMPDDLRGDVLDGVDTEAFDELGEVSEMLLMMDPHRFAVKSYLHFFRPQNRAESFKQLLTGKF